MSPVVFGSAPPQTAITAAKSLRWASIASRRVDGVDRLVLVDAWFSIALVCLRSSWALVTSSTQSSSRLTSERNRDKAMEKSGLWAWFFQVSQMTSQNGRERVRVAYPGTFAILRSWSRSRYGWQSWEHTVDDGSEWECGTRWYRPYSIRWGILQGVPPHRYVYIRTPT